MFENEHFRMQYTGKGLPDWIKVTKSIRVPPLLLTGIASWDPRDFRRINCTMSCQVITGRGEHKL
jgi:hypothetical protein